MGTSNRNRRRKANLGEMNLGEMRDENIMKENTKSDLGFIHQFIPATNRHDQITLLLLHGTGGNEQDLVPLGRELNPRAAILSPRGKVLESGMPRFFRRLAEGVFDIEDLKFRISIIHNINQQQQA